MTFEKPKLDREILEDHGIVYTEAVHSPSAATSDGNDKRNSPLPDLAESTRQVLLYSRASIPDNARSLFEEELHTLQESNYNVARENVLPPESAYFTVPNYGTLGVENERDVAAIHIGYMQEIAEISRTGAAANASEERWSSILHSLIFQDYNDTGLSCEKNQ